MGYKFKDSDTGKLIYKADDLMGTNAQRTDDEGETWEPASDLAVDRIKRSTMLGSDYVDWEHDGAGQ